MRRQWEADLKYCSEVLETIDFGRQFHIRKERHERIEERVELTWGG